MLPLHEYNKNTQEIQKTSITVDLGNLIGMLSHINKEIEILNKNKVLLEQQIAKAISHPDNCSTTYRDVAGFKLVISSGYNYSLNISQYEEIKTKLPKHLSIVTERKAYDLRLAALKDWEYYVNDSQDAELKSLFDSLITKKPKKLHIKVEEEK